MLAVLLPLIVATAPPPTSQPAVPEYAQRYLKASSLQRAAQIDQLKIGNEDLKKRLRKEVAVPRKRRNMELVQSLGKQIRRNKKEARRLKKSKDHFTPEIDPFFLGVGDIGEFTDESQFRRRPYYTVFQVISENEMLVQVSYTQHTNRIVGNSVFPGTPRKVDGPLLWVAGLPTGNTSDGEPITLPGVFDVTRTTTYPTRDGGTKTVRVVMLVDVSPYIK